MPYRMDDEVRPLVLLESLPAAEIARSRLPRVEEPIASLVAEREDAERCYRILRERGERKPALRFLCVALRRRVQVWFGYCCLRRLLDEARAYRKKLAQKGELGTLGLIDLAQKGGDDGDSVFGVSLDVGVSEQDFAPDPPIVDGLDLSSPSSWPAPSFGPDHSFNWLPAPLADLGRSSPVRDRFAFEEFFDARKAHIDGLDADARRAWLAMDAHTGETFRRSAGGSADQWMDAILEVGFTQSGNQQETDPKTAHNRLKAGLESKEAEIKSVLDGHMKGVHAALAGVPKAPPLHLSGDTPLVDECLEAVRRWVLDPSHDKGRAAATIGEQTNGMEQGAGLLAQACFWSGTDIKPAGAPADMPAIPPPPALAPNGVYAALEMVRPIPDSGRTPDAWLDVFLDIGEAVANGTNTWDVALHERPDTSDPWSGRSGFGRRPPHGEKP